jgi:hypothetical protein
MHMITPTLLLATALAAPSHVSDREVPDDLTATIERATAVLLERQEDMSSKDTDEKLEWPYEGVYRVGGKIPIGYRVGGTAISAWALVESPQYKKSAEVRAAVERALGFVLEGLDEDLMASGFKGGYDVRGWGHTYALNLMLRMRAHEVVPKKHKKAVDKSITWLVKTLEETEIPQIGGWNYSRRAGFGKPTPASPFMTAPTLLALYEAKKQGEKFDPEIVERALASLDACRTDEGAYPYTTRAGRDEMPGAIGRTPATEVALALAGKGDAKRLKHSLDSFFEHWNELEVRRQKTGTHIAPYGVAPYYFYYAHYYAALAIEFLPEDDQPKYRARYYEKLFETQEESGGWNDRVFDRSENYGTAMSLLSLLAMDSGKPTAWKE